MTCAEYPNESYSCGTSNWNPAANVTFTSGVHYVNASWLAGVIANPWPTWTCDDAYLALTSGGGIEVGNASSGELLYLLGLRNNDVPLSVNGMPLDNFMDGWDAFLDLYVDQGETDYTLTVLRGSSIVTLYYELV